MENKCSVPSCPVELGEYQVLCRKHWKDVPAIFRKLYWADYWRLQLDERLPRALAWGNTVKKLGVIDASAILARYTDTLNLVLWHVKEKILWRICQEIREDSWNQKGFTNKTPA